MTISLGQIAQSECTNTSVRANYYKSLRRRRGVTYTNADLLLNRVHYFVDASPLVFVFGAALDHTEALQDVDDVIDSATFDTQLFRALVEIEETSLGRAIKDEESAAEFSQAFLFAIVSRAFTTVVLLVTAQGLALSHILLPEE